MNCDAVFARPQTWQNRPPAEHDASERSHGDTSTARSKRPPSKRGSGSPAGTAPSRPLSPQPRNHHLPQRTPRPDRRDHRGQGHRSRPRCQGHTGFHDNWGKSCYYLTDALASVIGSVDEAGTNSNTYDCNSRGETRATTKESAPTPYRYAGAYQDPTQLYKMGARYYDTNLGRFTQTDPSGQETNPYLYVTGDPVNRSDPGGLFGFNSLIEGVGHALAAGAAGFGFGAGIATCALSVGAGCVAGIASGGAALVEGANAYKSLTTAFDE